MMKNKRFKVFLLIFVVIYIITIFQNCMDKDGDLSAKRIFIMEKDLRAISNSKIFFGHQSVGNNIIQGIKDLSMKYQDISINFLSKTQEVTKMESYFLDIYIGTNGDPFKKCDDFYRIIDEKLTVKPDVAFMKFCYLDLNSESDVIEIFNYYRQTMNRLIQKYPEMTILYTTAPLIRQTPMWKKIIKNLMRKTDYTEETNIRREEYNQIVRNTFPKEYLFDLAELESTRPNGSRVSFQKNNKIYFALADEYTYDDGHLNQRGRIKIAEELIRKITQVLRKSNK